MTSRPTVQGHALHGHHDDGRRAAGARVQRAVWRPGDADHDDAPGAGMRSGRGAARVLYRELGQHVDPRAVWVCVQCCRCCRRVPGVVQEGGYNYVGAMPARSVLIRLHSACDS